VIGYVEHKEYRRKKTKATKKKKKGEKEKEIWSSTDGMYDATRYIKKKKTAKA
jgi:hypothetical protein